MATAKFVQIGQNIEYTATADIAYNDVVAFGSCTGVAQEAIASGETGTITLVGVFDIPAATGAITAGAQVYFDTNNDVIVAASGSNTVPAGIAIAAKTEAGTTARVKIG